MKKNYGGYIIVPDKKSGRKVFTNIEPIYDGEFGWLIDDRLIEIIRAKGWNGVNEWFTWDNFFYQIGVMVFSMGLAISIISFFL